jgi:hypothetical protein
MLRDAPLNLWLEEKKEKKKKKKLAFRAKLRMNSLETGGRERKAYVSDAEFNNKSRESLAELEEEEEEEEEEE